MYLEGDDITIEVKQLSYQEGCEAQLYLGSKMLWRPEYFCRTTDFPLSRVIAYICLGRGETRHSYLYLFGLNNDGSNFRLNECEIVSMLNFISAHFDLRIADEPCATIPELKVVIYAAWAS